MNRLSESARYFGVPFDRTAIEEQLREVARCLPAARPSRLKVTLSSGGGYSVSEVPLKPLAGPVEVVIHPRRVDSGNLFLRHKSSERSSLDEASQSAQARGAFDALLFNERDELTQGGRSNVFLKLDGRWVTPSLHSGVLPGIMRSALLDDGQWQATECVVTRSDLHNATEVVVCNALRGPLVARLSRW